MFIYPGYRHFSFIRFKIINRKRSTLFKLLVYEDNNMLVGLHPNWLEVEYAITRLTSFWTKPEDAAKKAVKAPIIEINVNVIGVRENIGDNLINKYTPAVTIVAACNKADTGVGHILALEPPPTC